MEEQASLFDDQPRPGEYPIPSGGRPGTCRSCGRALVWMTTPGGKLMPLDLTTGREISGVRYAMNHFATCPQGKEWSKK